MKAAQTLLLIGPNFGSDRQLQASLAELEMELKWQRSVEEALLLMGSIKPAAILLAHPQPDLDLAEFMSQINSKPDRSLPVLVIDFQGKANTEIECIHHQVWEYVDGRLPHELLAYRVKNSLERCAREKKLTAQIAQLQKFAHNVAHDIKNPLSTLLGSTETMIDSADYFSAEDQLEMLQIVEEAGLRLNNIVDELQLLEIIAQPSPTLENVDPLASLRGALRRTKALVREMAAEVYQPEEMPLVRAQAQMVEEIWKTFICKAVQCGQTPLQLIIEQLEVPEGYAAFQMVYNGQQDHPDYPQNTFAHPFEPAEIRTKGRGLGLPAVKYMVERLGGAVSQDAIDETRWRLCFLLPVAL